VAWKSVSGKCAVFSDFFGGAPFPFSYLVQPQFLDSYQNRKLYDNSVTSIYSSLQGIDHAISAWRGHELTDGESRITLCQAVRIDYVIR
jgi:hypothetical protein